MTAIMRGDCASAPAAAKAHVSIVSEASAVFAMPGLYPAGEYNQPVAYGRLR